MDSSTTLLSDVTTLAFIGFGEAPMAEKGADNG